MFSLPVLIGRVIAIVTEKCAYSWNSVADVPATAGVENDLDSTALAEHTAFPDKSPAGWNPVKIIPPNRLSTSDARLSVKVYHMNIPWWGYVIMAGLAWGCYVPLVFYGGTELGGKPNSRIMAILCVGVAYFVIAVMLPLGLFLSGQEEWPEMKTTGLVFAGMAGVAGAIGAICVIFASKAAVAQAKAEGVDPATYRLFIAPLIFALAPVINTLLSSIWDPQPGKPFHFEVLIPGWKMLLGIVLVGAGTFFVLYSKDEAEDARKKAHAKGGRPPSATIAATANPTNQP